MGFFRNIFSGTNETKTLALEEEIAEKAKKVEALQKITLSTLSNCMFKHEILTIVWSSVSDDPNKLMADLQVAANGIGADAVFGIKFDTVGLDREYMVASANSDRWTDDKYYYSTNQSRAYGTAIRYLK